MDINGLFSGGVECFVNPRVFIQFSSLRTMQSARTEQQTKNGSKGKKSTLCSKTILFLCRTQCCRHHLFLFVLSNVVERWVELSDVIFQLKDGKKKGLHSNYEGGILFYRPIHLDPQ
ncbi:hypothetical protein NPIL_125941 [Nephila pilipes]|uniref:Uncharacterized protein n=1 Tax=Nephila pilipes TaxID=299642 RepID=A0A8X6ULC4_NEPPI|nr:hypothetical protein NPIL_125941 [Nephila pilipes]